MMATETPTVSVIICCRNAEGSLAAAIESALAQEGIDLELIVVDDASSDGTHALAQRFEARHPSVRAIRLNRNLGPAGARNIALERARGEWIALLDADDRFGEGRLTMLIALARTWDAQLAADNLWLVDERSSRPIGVMLRSRELQSTRLITPISFVRNNMPIDVKRKYGLLKPIIRRDFLEENNIKYDESAPYGEDFLLYFSCLIKGARFVLTPEARYAYTLSRQSLTRTRSLEAARGFMDRCEALFSVPEVRRSPELVEALIFRSMQLRSDLEYLKFGKSLKENRIREAIKFLTFHPNLVTYILRHFKRTSQLYLGQLVTTVAPKLFLSAEEPKRSPVTTRWLAAGERDPNSRQVEGTERTLVDRSG